MNKKRRSLLLASLLGGSASLPGLAHAADFPDHPIRLEVGFAAGTPAPVVARLHDALVAAMKTPEVEATMKQNSLQTVASSPDAFQAKLRRESAFWAANAK